MENNLITKFTVTIPGAAASLPNFIGEDVYRPQFSYIALLPKDGFIAATDQKFMQVFQADFMWDAGQEANLDLDHAVLIDTKTFAKMVGHTCDVALFKSEKDVTRKVKEGRQWIEKTEKKAVVRVEVVCNNIIYTSEMSVSDCRYPDVKRVLPRSSDYREVHLTKESTQALIKICRLHSNLNHIVIRIVEGESRIVVLQRNMDTFTDFSCSLPLKAPAQISATIALDPKKLLTMLRCCNGTIKVYDEMRPFLVDGEAYLTMLMPMKRLGTDKEINNLIKAMPACINADYQKSASDILSQMQDKAMKLWKETLKIHRKHKSQLHPGSYSALDVYNSTNVLKKNKIGLVTKALDDDYEGEQYIFTSGNIRLQVGASFDYLLMALTQWEAGSKQKTTFTVYSDDKTEAEQKAGNAEPLTTNRPAPHINFFFF